jgi:hypothetical protein
MRLIIISIISFILLLAGTLASTGSTAGVEGVQYFWYPVQVAFSSLSSTPARSSHGQSGGSHFHVSNVEDGSYHFGYDTSKFHTLIYFSSCGKSFEGVNSLCYFDFADTERDKSYREERRDSRGRVTGSYGYVDPDGVLRVVNYIADEEGFRSVE